MFMGRVGNAGAAGSEGRKETLNILLVSVDQYSPSLVHDA